MTGQPLCGPHDKAAQKRADAVYFRTQVEPHPHVGGPFFGCDECGQVRDADVHQVPEEVPASE